MRRITSALFLDFDNIFSDLLSADREAAQSLVDGGATFLKRLEAIDEGQGTTRDVLIRRAYLNPEGTVRDPALPPEAPRTPLPAFRSGLVRSGFEVVDCPTLSSGQKNAADIRMVIDVLDAMTAPVRYDEVIIASRDADFSPLLVKLRSLDRRTMILASGKISAAYEALADRRVDGRSLVALLGGTTAPAKPRPVCSVQRTLNPQNAPPKGTPERRARDQVRKLVAAADQPIALNAMGTKIREHVPETATSPKWFGRRNLSGFIDFRLPELARDTKHVWDPEHHAAPEPEAAAS